MNEREIAAELITRNGGSVYANRKTWREILGISRTTFGKRFPYIADNIISAFQLAEVIADE